MSSSFKGKQLKIRVACDISTRYRYRERSLAPIVDLISGQYSRKPADYLAFFSSFDYRRKVTLSFREKHPEIPIWEQTPGMEEPEQQEFLARFKPMGCGIGFAVLGGAFAEGIDLPSRPLTGAFIATLGLPQVNLVNEQMRERINSVYGAGYNCTHLFLGCKRSCKGRGV